MRQEKAGLTKPIRAFNFLQIISTTNGHYPLSKLSGKEREKAVQDKKNLQNILKTLFPSIKTAPFKELNRFKINDEDYFLKIKLIPSPTFRSNFIDAQKKISDQTETNDQANDDPCGIKEYYHEQVRALPDTKTYLPNL